MTSWIEFNHLCTYENVLDQQESKYTVKKKIMDLSIGVHGGKVPGGNQTPYYREPIQEVGHRGGGGSFLAKYLLSMADLVTRLDYLPLKRA